jgi:hypothetical protein
LYIVGKINHIISWVQLGEYNIPYIVGKINHIISWVQLGEYNIPTLKKREKNRANPQDDDGPVELFPSSDESDEGVGLTLR